jgi:hypothetical protein
LRPSLLSLTKDLDALLRKADEAGLSDSAKRELEAEFWRALRPDDVDLDPQPSLPSSHLCPLPPSLFPRQSRDLRRAAQAKQRKSRPSIASKVLNLGPELIESRLRSWRAVVPYWRGGGGRGMAFGDAPEASKGPLQVGEQRRLRAVSGEPLAKDSEWGFREALLGAEETTVVMPGGGDGATCTTRILVSKHCRDGSFWGQLRIQSPSSQTPIQAGPFVLGSQTDATHYVYQYLDMVTEGGRKAPVSVLRNPPKPPRQ